MGKFHRTKVVTISPRVILVNSSGREVNYRQAHAKGPWNALLHNERVPLHWTDQALAEELSVVIPGGTYHPSMGFAVNQVGDFAVKMPSKNEEEVSNYLMRVEVQLHGPTFLIVFKEMTPDLPPYLIENETRLGLIIQQKSMRLPTNEERVPPMSKHSYAWCLLDEPDSQLTVRVEHSSFCENYCLDTFRKYPIADVHTERGERIKMRVEVVARGPTKVLRFLDHTRALLRAMDARRANPRSTFRKKISSGFLGKSQERREEKDRETEAAAKREERDMDMLVHVDIQNIGLSMISKEPREILFLSMFNVRFQYSASPGEVGYELRVSDVQVDNQALNPQFPVMLARHYFNSEQDEQDVLHLSMLVNTLYKSIDYYRWVHVRLWNLDLKMDIGIVNELLAFFNMEFTDTGDDDAFVDQDTFQEISSATISESKKVYVEEFVIHPVHADVTFKLSYGPGSSSRQATSHGTGDEGGENGTIETLLYSIGGTLANIEASLRLRSLKMNNVFATSAQLQTAINTFYQGQALAEMYKLFFSFECIGNPASLMGKLSTGVKDLVYEPYNGAVSSPVDFVVGIHKGASSLVKNSVAGVSGAGAKVATTLGAGLGAVTMDAEYLHDREMGHTRRPEHLLQGVTIGAQEFGESVMSGVKGIYQAPMRGAQEDGGVGVVRGVGIGAIGALVKPAVGLVDFTTRALQGVQSTATYFDKRAQRYRPQRAFGTDRRLTVYSWERAVAQAILRTIDDGEFYSDYLIYHMLLSEKELLLVSNLRVLEVHLEKQKLQWDISYSDVVSTEVGPNPLSVTITYRKEQWLASLRGKSPTSTHVLTFAASSHADTVARVMRVCASSKHLR
eukprot:TRINITY_DN3116_c0_g1_i2.p1 TRINITY_DN3116_c0_g1~~TRINITY_DN3116_c0_g1_i2.p1  ORF type:complete len:849 (+),score=328.54 TRINITY_DN3116_c0_g1_i2:513-3059(+)